MPDYSELLDHRAAQPNGHAAGPTPQQIAAFMRESARGAAVLTDLLDSPEWDIFRSVLLADVQRDEAERETIRNRIESGELVGDERARMDLRLQYLRGAIERGRRALDLPKDLIDRHRRLEAAGGGAPAA